MASLKSWFSILRWALIVTIIFLIIISIAPLIFVRNFEKEKIDYYYVINGSVMTILCILGLFAICYYFFWFTLVFGICLSIYLIVEIFYLTGNYGLYITKLGVIACSFTYCAVLKRFEHEALYGPY